MRTCTHCTNPIPDTRNARAKYCTPKCSKAAHRDSMQPCEQAGCNRPIRAKGLCGSHYNQAHQPHRHAATQAACAACGVMVMRPSKSDRRPTCSPKCRHALTGHAYAGAWGNTSHIAARAKSAGATIIEDFTSVEIFTRDNWTCYLCGDPVNTEPDCFDPKSPTIDHVVPLSKGGQHARANVRCACLRCNSTKKDRLPD